MSIFSKAKNWPIPFALKWFGVALGIVAFIATGLALIMGVIAAINFTTAHTPEWFWLAAIGAGALAAMSFGITVDLFDKDKSDAE